MYYIKYIINKNKQEYEIIDEHYSLSVAISMLITAQNKYGKDNVFLTKQEEN